MRLPPSTRSNQVHATAPESFQEGRLPASLARGLRRLSLAALLVCGLNSVPAPLLAQQRAGGFRAPQQARQAARPQANGAGNAQGPRNQEHLSEWMNRHRDLPVQQQQRALESEPGFRELPAETQQRMRDHLAQLNNMRPEQRNRLLEQNERIERLSVPQRQQVRGAMMQLGGLPEDRRRAVARAFRDLRSMPENQRQQYLDSPAYHSQFNDRERGTINNLMLVEPYLPGRPQ